MSVSMLGEAIVKYTANTSDLTNKVKSIKSEMSSVGEAAQKSGDGIFSSFKNAASGALSFGSQLGMTVFGIKNLAGAAVGLGEALLGPNASMEQTTVGFETLLGKGKKTQAFLKDLQNFAAATPFEFPELATDAEHMLAFGFSAKSVIPTLTNIGDAMGAMGKSNAEIDHMVEIFGQMHAAGKLNAGDMMQISSMGIPAWKMLADSMHQTIPEVQKLSSQGLIPADDAIKAVSEGMHKMFGGGMMAQSATFNGLLSTLKDNASAALRAFTGPLFDMAKSGLTKLGDLVSGPRFQEFATTMGKKVKDGVAQAGKVIQEVGGFLKSQLIPPIERLWQVIGPPILAFRDWADKVHLLQHVFEGLKTAFGGVVMLIGGSIGLFASILDFFMHVQGPGEAVRALLIGIGAAFALIKIGQFLLTVPALVGGFFAWAGAAASAAIATLAATWPILAIGAIIAVVVAGIILAIGHWGAISKWFGDVWKTVSTTVGGWFSWLGDKVHLFVTAWQIEFSYIGAQFSAFGTFIHNIISAVGKAFSGLGTLLHGIWDGIVGVVKGAINTIIGIINGFIGFIDSIQIHIPSIGVGPIHTPSFDWNGLGIPQIPYLASGGYIQSTGIAMVHAGETVVPATASASGGGTTIIFEVDSVEMSRLVNKGTDRLVRLKLGAGGRAA